MVGIFISRITVGGTCAAGTDTVIGAGLVRSTYSLQYPETTVYFHHQADCEWYHID